MEEGFSYVTALEDHISGPAAAEAKALEHLKGAVDHVGSSLDGATKHHGLMAKALEHGKDLFHEFTGALIPQIAVAELAAEGIKKLGEAIIEATHFALEAAEFKENTIAAYEAVTGTAEAAEETFANLDRLARSIHMPADKAHDLAKTLLAQGLENQELIAATISSVADLQRIGMESGAEKVKRIIETSLATGHFELSKRLLRGTGVNLGALYKDLAVRLHESVDQVKVQLEKGKIDAEVGIAAITEAINHGKIGEIAAKKWDISDAVTDFKNDMRAMFQDVDTGPLKQALVDFVSIFDQGSASGRTMHDVVTAGINGIIRWVARGIEWVTILGLEMEALGLKAYIRFFPVIDALVKIEHAVERVIDAFTNLGNSSTPFVERMGKALGPVEDAIGRILGPHPLGPAEPPVSGAARVEHEPAHAEGGIVHAPASGEMFASVKPGEMILPEPFARGMLDFGAPGRGPGGGGGRVIENLHVTIDMGGVAMHHVGSPEELRALMEETAADVFERAALELGGGP